LMHPDFRQSFRDRVSRVTNRQLKWQSIPMAAGLSGRVVRDQFAILVVPERASLFSSAAPTANADHLVEGLPARKCIVGGVNYHQSSALVHVLLKGAPGFPRPPFIGSVIVHDYGFISAEIGLELGRSALRRGGLDCNLEETGLLELFLQDRCNQLPLVIRPTALSVDEHDRKGCSGRRKQSEQYRRT